MIIVINRPSALSSALPFFNFFSFFSHFLTFGTEKQKKQVKNLRLVIQIYKQIISFLNPLSLFRIFFRNLSNATYYTPVQLSVGLCIKLSSLFFSLFFFLSLHMLCHMSCHAVLMPCHWHMQCAMLCCRCTACAVVWSKKEDTDNLFSVTVAW